MKTKIGAVSALAAVALGLAAGDAAAQVQNGVLTINGTGGADTLALRLQSGVPGVLELDIGDDGTVEQSWDRSTFTAVVVDARGGDDIVRVGPIVDEAITVAGGSGADTLTASSGEQTLLGGSGNDIVTGGFGNDTALLGSGADLYTWTPGGGSDVVEGEGGDDALDFDTSGVSETVDISADGSRVQLLRNVASIDMDLDGLERIGVDVLGGNDTVVAGDLAGTAVETVAVGLGVFGAGDGVADSVIVGATNGADSVEVGNAGDAQAVSGLGAEMQVSGGETHDEINVGTGEGDDTITTNVETTGAALFDVDGGNGTDTARYEGTAGADAIHVVSNGAKVRTGGLTSAPFDTIVENVHVRGLGGDDTMTATGNVAALSQLTFDGGAGGDNLRGGNGADLLLGGSGNDLVDGNQGQDVAELGSGTDRFQWDPGDNNDTVEGQGGDDAVEFNGSSIGEAVALTANGARTVLTRNIANIAMDTGGIEAFTLRVLGGADTITVNEIAGTAVDVELNADGVADNVIANGTDGADAARISRSGGQARVRGLGADTRVTGSEAALDVLRVQTLAGDDEVTIESNLSDLIGLAVDLGADD